MHNDFIRKTFSLAKTSVEKGNHPFGAILVLDGKIVAEAENTVHVDNDVTRHAEMNLVSKNIARFSPEEKKRLVLYTSTEPCAMCSGAIVWGGIREVYYGCSAFALEEIAHGEFAIDCRDIFSRSENEIQVHGPLLEKEAVDIHKSYWI